jgi:apolipoprotein D and lipocalin family protein
MQLIPPVAIAATVAAGLVGAAAPMPAAATAPVPTTATPVAVEVAETGAGGAAALLRLLPGDAPRSLASAIDNVRDGVRDLLRRPDRAELPTAGPIDLERYSGKWYELARMPTRFQDQRTVSTAEYALRPDGAVEVRNTAWLGDEVDARIVGSATPARGAEQSNDRLRVRFGGVLRFIPVPREGNYWIIDRAEDYSTALVGTPDRRFLWVLARDKDAWGSAPIERMVDRARELGFDTDQLLVADWDRQRVRGT